MKCPTCATDPLKELALGDAHVHSCDVCRGIWINKEELLKGAEPEKHWLNVDLWEDKQKLKPKASSKLCPKCERELVSLDWNDNEIVADMCKTCGGLWIERGEYKKLLVRLKEDADDELLKNYAGTLMTQIKELFTGPKDITHEFGDVWTVVKFFQWKFAAEHPVLTEIAEELPFTK